LSKNKLLLMILDGVGLRDEKENNALKLAYTPHLDLYFKNYPWTSLKAHGNAVGLPSGIMGNSEVGHLNIGAGRIVKQNLIRIKDSLDNGEFEKIPAFKNLIKYLKENNKPLHLMGLLSDAGVHSDYEHLKKILLILKQNNVQNVYLHAITDGRDTPPNSGKKYLKNIIEFMEKEKIGKLSTVIGRFYTMDRDNRWDRVKIAYKALTEGDAIKTNNPLKTIDEMYNNNITDEFMKPIKIENGNGNGLIQDGDAVLTFNFRADRMREIAKAFNFDNFDKFTRKKINLKYVTMTKYQDDFPFPVLFEKEKLSNIFGEVVSKAGLTQLRIAETEKYAHVTYFFNGGEEKQFKGESHILIPSPKVETYDLQPEMNASIVTDKLLDAINEDKYDVFILNFANGDMVGHTGVLGAAIKALENLDKFIGKIVDLFLVKDGTILITADHGNCEEMWDYDNDQPHTQHTLNPVPFIVINSKNKNIKLKESRKLADIAPTMLKILDIKKPEEMKGQSIIDQFN